MIKSVIFENVRRALPRQYMSLRFAYRNNEKNIKKAIVHWKEEYSKISVIRGYSANSFQKMMGKARITIGVEDSFFYSIDENLFLCPVYKLVDNCSVDYSIFLDNSLEMLRLKGKDKFSRNIDQIIDGIEQYMERLEHEKCSDDIRRKINFILEMRNETASCLEDALQRILFINQLLWQTGHRLNGLGRLDILLEKYIDENMSDEILYSMITDFCKTLHKNYYFKSNELSGDTGQIIILGGCNDNGDAIENRLTYAFLQCIKDLKLPDPKILLRVSRETSSELLNAAIECMLSQTGSPLFANDEVIIDKLIQFGYETADARNYCTSACWEPVVGNSFEQNNLKTINFLQPINRMVVNHSNLSSYEMFLKKYFDYLKEHIDELCSQLGEVVFENDSFMSLCNRYCLENRVDISSTTGKYNNLGLLSVGVSNAVNSILQVEQWFKGCDMINISEMVYDKISLEETNEVPCFGEDNETVVYLTNRLVDFVSKSIIEKNNKMGGRYKFGLSAPGYLTEGKKILASPDGRVDGASMNVHISADGVEAPTELIGFAGKINLPINAFNGNVVDFMLSKALVDEHKEKIVDLIRGGVKQGFFELQVNLLDSQTLKRAKNEPERFPNLIVRVWGFSAYFNDLPDEYKDYLIERAIACESAC